LFFIKCFIFFTKLVDNLFCLFLSFYTNFLENY